MTRAVLPHLDPSLKAAVAAAAPQALAATGGAGVKGDVTGLHHLLLHHHRHHLTADLPLAPDPALTLDATDLPPAAAATAIAGMAAVAIVAPHLAVTGLTRAPTAAHLHQTETLVTHATGPAPGLPAAGTGTRQL